MNKDDRQRLEMLLEKYCDTTLSSAESTELNRRLQAEDAKEIYIEFMDVHSRLARYLASSSSNSHTELPLFPIPETNSASWLNWSSGTVMALLSLAAIIAIAAFIFRPNPSAGSFAARVVDKIDCDVEFSRWNSDATKELNVGQTLSVRRGLLSLEFGCGATVALQGPAEFKILSDKKGFLEFGNLTAHAPPSARGFTIETPTCTSVDLGTEFGIRVDATGVSETHVFEGEVLLFENDSVVEDFDQGLRLTANQASRVAGTVDAAVKIEANPKSFLRLPKGIDSRLVANNVPFDNSDQLKLWFDAGKYVETDESLRVVSWLDLTANGNYSSENAWQVNPEQRPFLIPDAINKRPAVRFMGQEHMVTEPLTTGNEITILIVAKLLPQELRRGRFAGIFSSGSPYGIRLFRNNSNHLITQKRGYWKDGVERHTAWHHIDQDFLESPVVLGIVYDHENTRSEFSVNGVTAKEGNAWAPIALDKSYFVGSLVDGEEKFVGDIAEVLLFDTAMDSVRLKNVANWLVDKYSLDSNRFVGTASPGNPDSKENQR